MPNRTSPKRLLSEVANDALVHQLLFPHKRSKPGEWIQKLSRDKREILERLTSDDIKDAMLRNQPYADDKPYGNHIRHRRHRRA